MGLFDWLFKKPSRSTQAWKVGDRVLARWADSFFYPGVIRQIADNTCQVFFDDGDAAWVHKAHILNPDIQVGSRVFARLRGGPAFLPGTVSQQKGETIQVRYDHGEEEWTSLSLVRVERAVAPVAGEQAVPPGAPAKPQIDLGPPAEGSNWLVGDRVLARWLDFFWYPGTILGMGSKGFHILYDDGDQRVVQETALMPLVVEEGEQIFIRPKNEPQRIYSPAQVTRVDGETLDVELEDGTRENNTKVTRGRFWRCPVGFKSLPFEEGDRVLAMDCDGCIYPAEIVSIQEDRVNVQFLDGPERMLTPELLKKFDFRVGSKIECRWKGAPNYFPGIIKQMEGDRVLIHYDDGDQEWTSIRLVRVPPAKGLG